MTFGEIHPNANIGYIVINNKQYPLYTADTHMPNVDFHYWIDKNSIIHDHNSFTNLPTALDRFTFSAIPLTQTSEKIYYGIIYL